MQYFYSGDPLTSLAKDSFDFVVRVEKKETHRDDDPRHAPSLALSQHC